MSRCAIFLLFIAIILLMTPTSQAEQKQITYIMEVSSSPAKVRSYIKRHYPRVEVLETYDTLLQALAVKGTEEVLNKLQEESFVQATHENQSYKAIQAKPMKSMPPKAANAYIPEQFNQTGYTGKGVKVGVIDTGIDLEHEDLQKNFQGGADLVEYKDEPSETTDEFGKTIHGTHVAGIIGADGEMIGVAPDSDIYAYRALGPNGFGSSVQVIAAMEKALEDGVDIINLSLGNTINIPDYPTSKAVNEATKHGVMVVVANGNDGPEDWTIGAPATASRALSVGAYQHPMLTPYIYHANTKEKNGLTILNDPTFWQEERSYHISMELKQTDILFIDETNEHLLENINEARIRPKAILIDQDIVEAHMSTNYDLPVAIVEKGEMFRQKERTFYRLKTEMTNETVAPFSSRGPVAMNWQMKPDLLGPGVQIISTIPGGYDILNGTSMATPHIAGALAVIKEARPEWTNEQIIGALKTTARKIESKRPTEQGNGLVQIEEAIGTNIIMQNPMLSFGKYHQFVDTRTISVEIENIGHKQESFHMNVPKKERGVTWIVPKSFTLQPKEKKTIQFELKVNSAQMEEGIHEGFVSLESDSSKYELPYMYIVKEAEYKKVDGFELKLHPNQNNKYAYEFYASEEAEKVEVFLFDKEDFLFEEKLLTMEDMEIGKNEGEFQLKNEDINLTNRYVFVFVIQMQDGKKIVEYVDI